MLVITETFAALPQLDEYALARIKEKGYTVAEVDQLEVNFGEETPICCFTSEQRQAGIDRVKQWLYTTVADPLFFKEQRGDVPGGTWKAAVEQIKADWPDVLE